MEGSRSADETEFGEDDEFPPPFEFPLLDGGLFTALSEDEFPPSFEFDDPPLVDGLLTTLPVEGASVLFVTCPEADALSLLGPDALELEFRPEKTKEGGC